MASSGTGTPTPPSHRATEEALHHAAAALSATVAHCWLPTPSLERDTVSALEPFDALWCAPGSPYESMEGALAAICYARVANRPFIGT